MDQSSLSAVTVRGHPGMWAVPKLAALLSPLFMSGDGRYRVRLRRNPGRAANRSRSMGSGEVTLRMRAPSNPGACPWPSCRQYRTPLKTAPAGSTPGWRWDQLIPLPARSVEHGVPQLRARSPPLVQHVDRVVEDHGRRRFADPHVADQLLGRPVGAVELREPQLRLAVRSLVEAVELAVVHDRTGPSGHADIGNLGVRRPRRAVEHRVIAIRAFAEAYGAKYPKAVAKIVDDTETLLGFFAFPAEHWIHLKTTNPIESTFAPVRLRTKVTKGPGSRAPGLAMAFKLIEAAEGRWRAVNGSHLVALVRAGAKFEKGVMVERPNQQDQEAAA
jgi:hypothetical protein